MVDEYLCCSTIFAQPLRRIFDLLLCDFDLLPGINRAASCSGRMSPHWYTQRTLLSIFLIGPEFRRRSWGARYVLSNATLYHTPNYI